MNTQNGEVIIEGDYATLKYKRRLAHPREIVWNAITDPKELEMWFNNKAVIDGRNGGTIDFVTGPAGFHTTGRILVWDPPRVFEHEWHTAPHPQLPDGESDRSEEHTSELQSRQYLVCRLLLEKKKNTNQDSDRLSYN